ncbi:Sec-independent protein translocase subunit TatA [Actinopolymorpha pittospori]|uniref:Sec-independent protein translocase protein TatA n=1 Tax=Actinopolymorpha pittospori TaxID=648752 RepID=A0A927N0X7_9ACTN|nr:Sec-independent protein translocase subunit TatA [Actinopolymorpha pittospori]MBE1610595.1 sec-independent protein translocase protein TatA [Actinopolymorpha pittospori]
MGSLGPTELIIIGVVLVLLFGATRLPQTAKGLGQALKIFKKEVRDEDKPQDVAAQAPVQSPAIQPNVNGVNGTPVVRQTAEDAEHTNR